MYSQIIKEGFLNLETVPEAKTLTNRGTFHKRLTLMILHNLGNSSRKRAFCIWASQSRQLRIWPPLHVKPDATTGPGALAGVTVLSILQLHRRVLIVFAGICKGKLKT